MRFQMHSIKSATNFKSATLSFGSKYVEGIQFKVLVKGIDET